MREPNDMPRSRRGAPGRGRVFLIIAAILLFLLFTSLRQIAEFWTEYLWFDSVNFSKVWSKTLFMKLELGALFTGVFFLVLWINLLIADRISPKFRPLGPDEELLHRYHLLVDRRAGTLRVVISAVFAVITGAGMSAQWQEWVLFNNGGDFGVADPQFQMDVGFYVFRLPFLVAVVDWLFASLVIVLLISAVAHYLNGGIRLQSPFERVTPQVKAHLSVLLAMLALAKAADYYLQRFQILFSERGVVNGGSYTEVNAQLPALSLLLFIAVMSLLLFLLNIRRRGWVLPIVAVGLWAFVQLAVGTAYPAIFQRIVVVPEESTKEAQAISNNIKATRAAYGLDKIVTKDFSASPDIAEATRAVDRHPETVRNIQLLDPKNINETFQKLQSQVSPSAFARVATDRYMMKIPGGTSALTQVVVANREVNASSIPQQRWEGLHLSYTHGYGLALAAGNAVTQGGAPDFAVRDIPVVTVADKIDLPVTQPNNYYFNTPGGPNSDQAIQYSIVGTTAPEFDFEKTTQQDQAKSYAGSGGVALDSLGRRVAFFLKFNDPNLLISQFITDQSRILFLRDIRQRAVTAAPFLEFDSNPYPVVENGHTVYVLDAYTTSDNYPNSQRMPRSASNDLRNENFNYVRNSVKAVIDTYDGSVSFYVVDNKDPVVEAWKAAFPELFKEIATMSQDLRQHLRYPEDIFNVQTDMWGRYHIDDPSSFYSKTDAWEPPPAPVTEIEKANIQAAISGPAAAAAGVSVKGPRMAPYYVMNQLPGDARANFMLMRQYQPFSDNDSKPDLTSFIVARCDGDDLGQLQLYKMSNQQAVDGPSVVGPSMLSDPTVSSKITQLNQQGSKVLLSDLIMVPLDRSVLYVRSLSLVTDGAAQQKLPLVRAVIVSINKKVVIADTLRDALERLLPGSKPQTLEGGTDAAGTPLPDITPTPPTTGPGSSVPGSTPGSTPGSVPTSIPSLPPGSGDAAGLIAAANQDLIDAQRALDNADLAEYQRKVNEASRKIAEARALQSGSTTTSTVPTPSSTPSTSPVP